VDGGNAVFCEVTGHGPPLVLAGPIVSGLSFTGHFTSRGGRRAEAGLTVAEEIEYWSSIDPWFTAPANSSAGSATGLAHGEPAQPAAQRTPGAGVCV
jgi:hypothetical protein